jgi:hypothetical protein
VRFPFAFAPSYLAASAPLGITPWTAWVDVDEELRVRFGAWRLRTPLSNVTGAELSGDYGFVKTAGPPHLSFADRGVTFATNGDRGVCVRFRTPVRALWPLTHPGATLTVADPEGLLHALSA